MLFGEASGLLLSFEGALVFSSLLLKEGLTLPLSCQATFLSLRSQYVLTEPVMLLILLLCELLDSVLVSKAIVPFLSLHLVVPGLDSFAVVSEGLFALTSLGGLLTLNLRKEFLPV